MVLSLAACAKPADKTDSTESGAYNDTEWTYEHVENTGNYKAEELETGTGIASVNTEILNNDDLITPEKFEGKSLQIYGYSSAIFDDIDEMGQGSYIWMVRAAISEWSALNKVNIEFVGEYDQSVIMGDINSGGKPDLLLGVDKFPITATSGLAKAFTDAEYTELARTCGEYYLDMCNYKGQSYGVVSPWSGGTLFYYNKTLFEQYGVKSPAEYYKEGNWNWDTFETCITEITKDTDGDGKMDIYGTGTPHLLWQPFRLSLDDDGKITSLVRTSPEIKKYLEIFYKGTNETKAVGAYADCTIASNPRPATHLGDAEWYNFQHLNQELVNGDIVEVIPMPKYTNDSESYYQHTLAYSSILSSCDEPEAALSLLNYILRVGMRYMSDFSLSLYKCNYEGIRGASQYAAGWKKNFTEIVADRQEEFDALTSWDQELFEMLQAALPAAPLLAAPPPETPPPPAVPTILPRPAI